MTNPGSKSRRARGRGAKPSGERRAPTRAVPDGEAALSKPTGGHAIKVTRQAGGKVFVEVGPGDLSKMPGRALSMSGSRDDAFATYLLNQATMAAGISPTDAASIEREHKAAMTAAMGIAPRDELEGMIAAQLWAAHVATMDCYARAIQPDRSIDSRAMNLGAANKCTRSFAALVDALQRYRGKGQQAIRVEHVNVHSGGQAIVGSSIHHRGAGGFTAQDGEQPHAQDKSDASGAALPSPDPQRQAVSVSTGEGSEAMQDARRR